MNIHIITPVLPPKLDGIGDYTAHIAAELAKTEQITVITGNGQQPDGIDGATIQLAFSGMEPHSVCGILKPIARDPPDWVLLQYNPFAYGRWGLNLHLPEVMRRIKSVSPATRTAVMVHEPYVPFDSVKNRIMGLWQRWQFWRLAQIADVMFFSVGVWADKVRKMRGGRPTLHLPVGSNAPLVQIARDEARRRLRIAAKTLVLGFFGTAHAARLLHWVVDAAQAVRASGRDVVVLYIGPDGCKMRNALGDLPLIDSGIQPAEEISRQFAAMDIYLSPFVDGVSTRRTSLMTALQHSVATAGTVAIHTDAVLSEANGRSIFLADTCRKDRFTEGVVSLAGDDRERHSMGARGGELYTRNFAWEVINAALRNNLKTNDPGQETCQ